MKNINAMTPLIATALLISVSLSFAADAKPESAAAPKTKASASSPATKKVPAANIKQVDINSASKAELMKLPDISEAVAGKIIAGRPYFSKAHLVTHNIISETSYHSLKTTIVAKQNETARPKK